jgi:hypothetical protein
MPRAPPRAVLRAIMIISARLAFACSGAFLLIAPGALAQEGATDPAAAPAPTAAPAATAPAEATPSEPTAVEPTAAPAAPAAKEAPAAAPAWPQSRSECLAWADNPPKAALPQLEDEVPERYVARVIPTIGGAGGGGLGSDPGFGFRVGGQVDVGVASPLWLSGAAYYASAPEGTLHADVLTGFSFVSWGTRWVEAGAAAAGGAVTAWNSHCQMRRNELSLLAGGKLVIASESITALQAGFGESFKRDGGFTNWSLTGLYDPANTSYGGQLKLGFAGGFLPYPVYMGMVAGGMTGDRKAWWGALDLGATFEL